MRCSNPTLATPASPENETSVLLEGAKWRIADGLIPLATVQTLEKRIASNNGYELEEVASELGVTLSWVEESIASGLVRVAQVPWDLSRRYLSVAMVNRLRRELKNPMQRSSIPKGTLGQNQAAMDAGVATGTLKKWIADVDLPTQDSRIGPRVKREDVRKIARSYWQTARFKRAHKPGWLVAELAGKTD